MRGRTANRQSVIPFPRINGVQGRLGIIFLAFLLLLVVSVTVTFASLDTQKQDARVINLAGRQRMLLQQMTGLALGFEHQTGGDPSALRGSSIAFAQTLSMLRDGGQMVDYTGGEVTFSPPESAELRAALDELQADWQVYQAQIEILLNPTTTDAISPAVRAMERLTPGMVALAERAVQALEAESAVWLARLRTFQLAFLVAGLVLLSAGWWMTRRAVVQPLAALEQAAQRVGEGDLASPVQVDGPEEVRVLSRTMDEMRVQLLASREDLRGWAAALESGVQQRTQALEVLAAVSQEINSHLAIGEVLHSVTEKAQTLLGSEVAALCLLDQQKTDLHLHAAAGPQSAIWHSASPANSPYASSVLNQGCTQVCGIKGCQSGCRVIHPDYRASQLAAPLRSGEKVIGALCVGSSHPGAFRQEMMPVLTQLAGSAAVALENSRLYQQAEQVATLEERQRIASEMHDGLLQTLSFLRMMVRFANEQLTEGDREKLAATLKQIERAEAQAEQEIRRAINSLQDDFPVNIILQEQLTVLAEELSTASATTPVRFSTSTVMPVVLPRHESEQVLRVAREALLNAQRYSRAEAITVTLQESAGEMVLTVRDNGIGFCLGQNPQDGRSHFGIKIMQARAARMGGRLSIESAPGQGTTVHLRWSPAAVNN